MLLFSDNKPPYFPEIHMLHGPFPDLRLGVDLTQSPYFKMFKTRVIDLSILRYTP